jgi:hypothetical protein
LRALALADGCGLGAENRTVSEPSLLTVQYVFFPVHPTKNARIRNDLAITFENWLTSQRTADLINGCMIKSERPFFNAITELSMRVRFVVKVAVHCELHDISLLRFNDPEALANTSGRQFAGDRQ